MSDDADAGCGCLAAIGAILFLFGMIAIGVVLGFLWFGH